MSVLKACRFFKRLKETRTKKEPVPPLFTIHSSLHQNYRSVLGYIYISAYIKLQSMKSILNNHQEKGKIVEKEIKNYKMKIPY